LALFSLAIDSKLRADWLEFKPYIDDGDAVVVSPQRSSDRRPMISSFNCASEKHRVER
jgi:hypothetical protein